MLQTRGCVKDELVGSGTMFLSKTASSYTVLPAALESGLHSFGLPNILCGLRKYHRDGLKSAETIFNCIDGHNLA